MRVFAVSFNASLGFKPSCECVAHTGYQQPRRTVRNDLRIDEHQIRILCVNPVTQKSTTVGVDYRQSTARSVARGHGRAVDHRQIEIGCNGARGSSTLPTPEPTITRTPASRACRFTRSISDKGHSPPKGKPNSQYPSSVGSDAK